MEVRIGVTQTPKEIVVELDDDKRDQVTKDVENALASGPGVLWLSDRRGRTVGISTEKLAYVEIGVPDERRVGFAL